MKIQGNRIDPTLAGPMYQDIYTNKSDNSILHLKADHNLVTPYNSEQRRRNK